MKPNKWILLLGLLMLVACSSDRYWKLRIEAPGKSSLNLDKYEEIALTDFLLTAEAEGFDLNQEIGKYFAEELKQKFKKSIFRRDLPIEKEELFTDEEFWKSHYQRMTEALFFTGSAEYTAETRKAILREQIRGGEDPFSSTPKLAERKFYTLLINLYLIDAQTGKVIYKSDFKETQSYKNPNQTAYFAFFDLIEKVKTKFFRDVLGRIQTQERYLIQR